MAKKILDSLTIDGEVDASGAVNAPSFTGSGAALTNIPQNAVLSGYGTASVGGNIEATDTIMSAIEKLEYKTNHISGGGGSGGGVASEFIHNQVIPNNNWIIVHNLGKYPVVTVVDSSGNVFIGDIVYNNSNTLTITFSSTFGGMAYLT